MSEPKEYAEGGYVGSGEFVTAYLCVDECLLVKRGDALVCVRADHDHAEAAT